jgi:hypothetical protein
MPGRAEATEAEATDGMAAIGGMVAAHGLALALVSGHSGDLIGHRMAIHTAIHMTMRMALRMAIRTRRWPLSHQPSFLSNPHPRRQPSRHLSTGTIVMRPKATIRMFSSAQRDGGR